MRLTCGHRRGSRDGPPPTSHALDGDVILCAQALTLGVAADDLVVATVNVGHLARFLTAKRWQDIP